MMGTRKFIIDCDVGTDDAQAILMALAQPDIQVVAITAVFGNASVEKTSYNALRLLNAVGRTDIAIYPGCHHKLVAVSGFCGDGFMGSDGLGDAVHDEHPDRALIRKEHASVKLVELANAFPGEINLVATGPLTNIAVALKLDPSFGSKLAGFYVMGGNIAGKGNVTMTAEFNFVSDAEAVQTVLSGMSPCPLYLVSLDLCTENAFTWEEYDQIFNIPGKTADFIRRCEVAMNKREKNNGQEKYMAIWDQLVMAVAIDNKVAMEVEDVYMMIERFGEHTKGQCVIDWTNRSGHAPNIKLIKKVNRERFMELLTSGIKFSS